MDWELGLGSSDDMELRLEWLLELELLERLLFESAWERLFAFALALALPLALGLALLNCEDGDAATEEVFQDDTAEAELGLSRKSLSEVPVCVCVLAGMPMWKTIC